MVVRPPLAPLRRRSSTLPDGTIAFGSYSVRTALLRDAASSCARPRRVAARRQGQRPRRRSLGHRRHPPAAVHRPRRRRAALQDARASRAPSTLASRRFQATERGRWRVELRVRRAAHPHARSPSAKARRSDASRRSCSRRATRRCRASTASSPTSSPTRRTCAATCSPAAASAAASTGSGTRSRRPSACASASRVMSVGAASDGLPIPTAIGVLQRLLRRAVDRGVRQPRPRDHADVPARRVAGASSGSRRPSRARGRAPRSRTRSTSRSSAPRAA